MIRRINAGEVALLVIALCFILLAAFASWSTALDACRDKHFEFMARCLETIDYDVCEDRWLSIYEEYPACQTR